MTERWGPCECFDTSDDPSDSHWEGCHLHPVELTKAQFVEACEGGAAAAIEAYQFCLDEGDDPELAKTLAVSEAGESGACFIGIGSCFGGGCLHN